MHKDNEHAFEIVKVIYNALIDANDNIFFSKEFTEPKQNLEFNNKVSRVIYVYEDFPSYILKEMNRYSEVFKDSKYENIKKLLKNKLPAEVQQITRLKKIANTSKLEKKIFLSKICNDLRFHHDYIFNFYNNNPYAVVFNINLKFFYKFMMIKLVNCFIRKDGKYDYNGLIDFLNTKRVIKLLEFHNEDLFGLHRPSHDYHFKQRLKERIRRAKFEYIPNYLK